MTPSLDIIIVNWNAGKQLLQCLASIESANKDGFTLSSVCVVDNASHDSSVDGICDCILPIQVIRNGENRGFAAACNQGARASQSNYLLFLNPDVKLFEKSLTIPIAFMERPENKRVSIVGIQLLDELGDVARTCYRFPTPGRIYAVILGLSMLCPNLFPDHFMKEWGHKENRTVDQVIGAFFLVRRQIFERLGGFDERFFVYFEDIDFSYRAWKAGSRSIFLADAQAYHKGGGTSRQIKDMRLFYILRSRILYSYKHFGWRSATMVTLMTVIVEPITRLIWAAMRISGTEIMATLKGYFMLWRKLPVILAEARRRRKNEVTPTESL
jgi:N-acetylglucosaminyl-diphospho-decaprenol L-rhamnosyltransferase